MGIKRYTKLNIFNDDIFTNNSQLEKIINICNQRMKQLDSSSLLGSNADFTKMQKDKEFIENNIKIYNDKIKTYEKEIDDIKLAIDDLPSEDKTNRNELKKKQKQLKKELENFKYNLKKKERQKTNIMKTLDRNIADAGNIAKTIKNKRKSKLKIMIFKVLFKIIKQWSIPERKELFDKKKQELDDSSLKFNQSEEKVIIAEDKEKAEKKANKRRLFGFLPPSSENTLKLKEAEKETFNAKVNSEIAKRELENVQNEYNDSKQKFIEANAVKERRDLTKTNI